MTESPFTPDSASKPYPVALDLRGRLCVVVGGGAVALRKVGGLLRSGARIRLVSPTVCNELVQKANNLEIFERPFASNDVVGATLVFACTDSSSVNAEVVEAARQVGALVSRADQTSGSDFSNMASTSSGSLLVSVSTGSDSPGFAKWMRRRIESWLIPEYGELLEICASLRDEVKQSAPGDLRQSLWEKALDSDALEQLSAGNRAGAIRVLREKLRLTPECIASSLPDEECAQP